MKERRLRTNEKTAITGSLEDPKVYEEHAIQQLREAGFRITMPRVQVIRALADTHVALSAYGIHEKILDFRGKIDVVSVYRILSTLKDVGLIYHIGVVDGYFPCRLPGCSDKRSQVVVCEETGMITEMEIPADVMKGLESQAAAAGFELSGIKIELTASKCPDDKGKKKR